jgi:hypothetical protein
LKQRLSFSCYRVLLTCQKLTSFFDTDEDEKKKTMKANRVKDEKVE